MEIRSLEGVETFLFDIDGTIMVDDQLLPYVKETIQLLKGLNKKVFYLTNTTIRTRQEVKVHLENLSLLVELEEIITAASLSGSYFRTYTNEPNVMVIGEEVVELELKTYDIPITNNPNEATHVLVGLDKRFTYEKLYKATKAVRMGAKLIGINPDPFCPLKDDVIPDTGSLLKAIEVASNSEVLDIIGKPSKFCVEEVLKQAAVQSEQCLMIGDRLDTDILFGQNAGMKTALVLTGVTSETELAESAIRPHLIFPTLESLTKLLTAERHSSIT